MNVQYLIIQAAVYAASGIAIILISWYFIKTDILNLLSGRSPDGAQQKESAKAPLAVREEEGTLLQLRLQAHERMILFTDRLNPSNLFLRLYEQGISAAELQAVILNEVRSEFQHNVSQQLYISGPSWEVLRKLKDDTIAMINNATGTLPADASGKALSKVVLEHMSSIAENPYDLTIALIKQDIHKMF